MPFSEETDGELPGAPMGEVQARREDRGREGVAVRWLPRNDAVRRLPGNGVCLFRPHGSFGLHLASLFK